LKPSVQLLLQKNVRVLIGGQCYDLKNIFAKKMSEIIGVFS
jgi:hypothetical protein